jgi:molybdopterin synthase catalytic subunit
MDRAFAEISRSPIRLEPLAAFVADDAFGAQSFFVGVVRNENGGRRVEAVTYEGFEPLACKVLRSIGAEAAERWGAKLAAVHRLGRLGVGEASVAVAAGAAHRAEAFEACRWAIDEIKRRLPIWKREHYAGGHSAWLEGRELSPLEAPR